MTFDDYERHVRQQLCWQCHRKTQVSHRQQRQCPQCRAKWSYQRRLLQLDLLSLFSSHFNAHEASKKLSVAYRTAWTHFMFFETTFRRYAPTGARHFLRDPLLRDREVRALLKRHGENRVISELLYHAAIRPPRFRVSGHRRVLHMQQAKLLKIASQMKRIRLSKHAEEQRVERGPTEAEVEDAIRRARASRRSAA